MLRVILLIFLLVFPVSANATWRQAETEHFVIYSEESDTEIRAAAEKLERYEFLLATLWQLKAPPSPVKVTIYMLPSFADVEKSLPFPSSGIAGYYDGDIRATYAVIGDEGGKGDMNTSGQQVLFHELMHHFMFQYFPGTYPTWYSEGIADYFGATRIKVDGTFELGNPDANRYVSIFYNPIGWISTEHLLSVQNYSEAGGPLDLFYAEGWALVHYLWFNKAREGQLTDYLKRIKAGASYSDAATAAFGNLDKLDTELRAYVRRTSLPTTKIRFEKENLGPIQIGPVSPARNALMLYDLSLNAGVAADDVTAFAARLRRAAAPYPDDPFALKLVTEADRLAGASEEEIKTVEHWNSVAPGDPMAMLHLAEIRLDRLKAEKSTDAAAWTRARAPILAAIRITQTSPEILKGYYDSFIAEGVMPPPGAQNGLFAALDLVPQSEGLRYALAADYEARGLINDALSMIRPAALAMPDEAGASPAKRARAEKIRTKYRLAGETDHETAREMYTRLSAKIPNDGKPGKKE